MTKIFGTDGIRGTANIYPMTADIALYFGKAAALMFRNKNRSSRPKILIGKDTRLSGYIFEYALTAGILSMGVDVYLVGPMPTPAIAQLTRSMNADAGIAITASHNPAQDNGLKLFSGEGYKLNDNVEEEMEKLIMEKLTISEDTDEDSAKGKSIGKAFRINDAAGRYIEHAKNSISSMPLNGIKIVIDCANGAAYKVAPVIFSELGAKVIPLNNDPNGMNINLDCGALYPEKLAEAVKKNKADVGIALDGDADRIIFVDEKGKIINGDVILALAAFNLKKKNKLRENTVVCTVMSNSGFENKLKENGIKVIRTAVGDRYISEVLKKENYSLGGEESGHIIFSDYSTTGDGIITALQILRIMNEEKKTLSELSAGVPLYPKILINVNVKEKRDVKDMPCVAAKIKKAEEKLKDKGRFLFRYSGTENLARIMVEGSSHTEIEKIANDIADAVKKEVGL